MIANVDDYKYGALLAAARPGVITNDAEEDYERRHEPLSFIVDYWQGSKS
jgi:hypothetical protein